MRHSRVFKLRSVKLVLTLAVLLTFITVCDAQHRDDAAAPATFIRVQRNAQDEPMQLQTSIVRFQTTLGGAGLVVDLIGAVHIGEASYYEKLNQVFEQYESVLYELVAKKGVVPTANRRNSNLVSMMQHMAGSMLGLEAQMEHIDYSPANFVHADMTPQEINEAMKARGDNRLSVTLDVMADLIRENNKQQQRLHAGGLVEQADPFGMLLAPDRDVQLKRMMAEQFAATGSLETGLGPTLHKMLIADRNAAAMRVLHRELAKGRKRIAIFYGAAHMPDFERRLGSDLGLKPVRTTWLAAWDLTSDGRSKTRQPDPLQELFKLFQ